MGLSTMSQTETENRATELLRQYAVADLDYYLTKFLATEHLNTEQDYSARRTILRQCLEDLER
jgi:hypothetical protein